MEVGSGAVRFLIQVGPLCGLDFGFRPLHRVVQVLDSDPGEYWVRPCSRYGSNSSFLFRIQVCVQTGLLCGSTVLLIYLTNLSANV